MWTQNVLREIFASQKINITPQKIVKNEDDALKYHFKTVNENESDLISIIKIERLIGKKDAKNTKIIINFRDPRDAVASYKRFMKHINYEFKDLLELVKKFIIWIEYYRKNFSEEQILEVHYKDIINQPLKIFKQFELFLELKISEKITSEIINKFSKNKVLQIIKKNDDYVKKSFKDSKNLNEENMIIEGNKIVRSYDVGTGFQTGHISNFKDGDWSNVFTEKEINIINTNFKDWLKNNNLKN